MNKKINDYFSLVQVCYSGWFEIM